MGRLSLEIGRALRRARQARDLTLRQVSTVTMGRFKPTSVAGYERGERTISVERFVELSHLYGIPPPVLLAEILEGQPGPGVDLETTEREGVPEGSLVSGFILRIRSLRRERPTDAIALRAGDLEVLASASGKEAAELVRVLESGLPPHDDVSDTP